MGGGRRFPHGFCAAGNGGSTALLEQDFGASINEIPPQNVPGASPLPPGEGQGEGVKRISGYFSVGCRCGKISTHSSESQQPTQHPPPLPSPHDRRGVRFRLWSLSCLFVSFVVKKRGRAEVGEPSPGSLRCKAIGSVPRKGGWDRLDPTRSCPGSFSPSQSARENSMSVLHSAPNSPGKRQPPRRCALARPRHQDRQTADSARKSLTRDRKVARALSRHAATTTGACALRDPEVPCLVAG